MNCDTFVETLDKLRPSMQDILAAGYSSEGAERKARSYTCTPRAVTSRSNQDELIALVTRYDATAVEIGLISFLAGPRAVASYTAVGKVEADYLAVGAGGVVQIDHASSGRVVAPAAIDGAHMLDALIAFQRGLQSFTDEPDDRAYRDLNRMCSSAAGGENYLPFWTVMLGVDGL